MGGHRASAAVRRTGMLVVVLMLAALAVTVGGDRSQAAADTVVTRINAGGPEIAGSPSWSVDTKAAPSSALVAPANSSVYSVGSSIDTSDPSLPAGTPASLFQTQRYDNVGKTDLAYAFPTTAGSAYELRLYFAETYTGAFSVGARVFDVSIDGALALDNFDVFAAAGAGNKGIMRSFTVVSDGTIDLGFTHVTENPEINGIELVQLGDPPPPGAAELSASSLSVSFPDTIVGQSVVSQLTFTNTAAPGSDSLAIDSTSITGVGAAAFSDSFTDGAPVTLAPGQSTTVTLTFAPTQAGAAAASLEVSSDAPGSPLVVSLAGTGVASNPGGPSQVLYRVNAGGALVSGSPDWSADTAAAPSPYRSGGSTWTVGSQIDTSDGSLPAGTPGALFQTQRYDNAGGAEMTWSFPTAPGQYEVRLYFAETYSGAFSVGARVFDVSIEGAQVLNDFDVYASAGAGNKGIMRSFTVNADSALDLVFSHVVENPEINAIEIVSTSSDPVATLVASPTAVSFAQTAVGSTSNQQVTLTNAGVAGAPSLQVTGVSLSGAGAGQYSASLAGAPVTLAAGQSTSVPVTFAPTVAGSPSASLQITHTGSNGTVAVALSGTTPPPVGSGSTLYRVNAGGALVSGSPDWSADTAAAPSPYRSGGSTWTVGSQIDTSDGSLPAGTPGALFQTQRYDNAGGAEMTWSFPTAPGQYEVRLYFAETYSGAFSVGARVFDVSIEGAQVLNDFDVYASAGAGNKGIMRSFTVNADSALDLVFSHVVENPEINAIEIVSTSSDPVATLVASPTAVSFAQTAVGSTSNQQVTLTNAGVAGAPSLQVTGVSLSGAGAGQYSASLAGAPVTLAAGQSTSVPVTFAPTVAGSPSASLQITHTGSNGTVAVALSGTTPPPVGSGSTLYRVNAGGPQISGTPNWSADTYATPSAYLLNPGDHDAATTTAAIDTSDPSVPVGTPAALFQSERWDSTGASEMSWSFPTTPGQYEVRLYFAETYDGAFAGAARQFDVSIEGAQVLNDFDQFSEAGGGNKGIMRSFAVTADSTLDIAFTHVVENPSLKGIEIISQVGAGLVATPNPLGFGAVTLGSASTKAVTVTNTAAAGSPSIDITGAEVTGTDAALFSDSFASGTVTSLNPGQSTIIDVTFSPAAATSVSATLTVTHTGAGGLISIPLSGSGQTPSGGGTVSFGKSALAGLGTGKPPTSLDWGPDGRLYVTYLDGAIQVADVERSGPNSYSASNVQTINLVKNMANHDDSGALAPSVSGRLVTGIDVVGTAQNPVIYLVSSDPRIGSPEFPDPGMDTNSGVLSRLTWNGSSWVKLDLVRGLPRSKEEHSVEGVIYLADSNEVLLMAGGQTNAGAPSANFKNLPEYALSAAILSVDLDAIGESTYDLPTLDDEDRSGVNDVNDPFGGNDGKNQAKLVPGGPVQVYAAGLRNAYDAVMTSTGLYTIDNGSNEGWGGLPQNEGPSGVCTDNPDNTGTTMTDSLHRITGAGYYGGHPNPTRGNMANTFNVSNPQSPVSVANPVECDWRPLSERGALAFFPTSTNGIAQFTTGNFGGALQGDLLAAGWDNKIYRIDLSNGGATATPSVLFNNVGGFPLDVIAGSATSPFPGVVLVADYGTRGIVVYEPGDFDGSGTVCTGANDPGLDEDGDGFTNADEIAAGTDPCSAGDIPSDVDGDHISDVTDPDDDNDGIPDVSDRFALDAENGLTTNIPVNFAWNPGDSLDSGILGLGLTGSMVNGSTDWLDTFDIANMTVVGAAGVVTIDQVPNGTADGVANDQQYGLQVGFDAKPADANTFEVSTSLPNPFGVNPPLAGQSYGIQIGTGTQSDFVKLVLSGDNGGELQLVREIGDVPEVLATTPVTVPGPSKIDLFLRIDPDTGAAQAAFTTTTGGTTSSKTNLGDVFTMPASWFDSGMAAGLIATSGGAATPLSATWDFLKVLDSPGTITPPATTNGATLSVLAGTYIGSSTYSNGAFSLTNTSTTASITGISIDTSTAVLPDLVFDPNGGAGDDLAKDLQIDSPGGTGYTGRVYTGAHDDGYDALSLAFADFDPAETVTFSVDVDPTSIRGVPAPGPGEAGSVSGLELTGATITVTYSDGTSHTGRLAGIPGSVGGSHLTLAADPPAAPTIQVLGLATGASTTTATQTLRVTGTPGTTVRVLQLEAGLYINGAGFDIDPLESNSATTITWIDVPIGPSGTADTTIQLGLTNPNAGYNHFIAAVDGATTTGTLSNHLLIQRTAS